MTLLGVPAASSAGGFNVGTSGSDPLSVGMSLDDLIASRRNKSRSQTAGGGRKSGDNILNDPNHVSNVDRSMATSRAKRNAAMRARRGQSTTPKASQMEIEAEVQKQGQQTLLAKAKKAQNQKKQVSKLDPADKAEIRNERRNLARAAAKAKKEQRTAAGGGGGQPQLAAKLAQVAETAPLGRPPSKKAVKAAVSAMEEKGFVIPQGYQMVISFAPTDSAIASDPSTGGGGGGGNAAKKGPPRAGGGGGNNNNNGPYRAGGGGNNNNGPYKAGGGGNNNRRGGKN